MREILIGSRWRDNDPRCRDRVVTVESADDHFVWYRFVVRCRSRRARFLKAFTQIETAPVSVSEASGSVPSEAL